MAELVSQSPVGSVLREWRERRRMSQLELGLVAGVSARHLSFVENGRSKPGREMLMRVLDHLEVPYRERNRMLVAAGHAPVLPEQPLDHPDLGPARDALKLVLERHAPNPGIVVDRAWNIVAANRAVARLAQGVRLPDELLGPPVNAVRASLHPDGLAPLILDIEVWRSFFRERLERQLTITADEEVANLLEELSGYSARDARAGRPARPGGVPGPLRMRGPAGVELSFLSMFAGFDTPFEVTTSELAIELLFPADRPTAEALEAMSARE